MGNKKQLTAVIALIKNKEGKILLQQRNDPAIATAHGKWEFPGGKIDFGESPEEALIRECQEEIGCDVLIKKILPQIQSKVWARAGGNQIHVIVMCYEAQIVSGNPRPMDQEVSDVNWFTKQEIKKLDTLVGIEDFIDLLK
mgnify:FL=1